MVFQFFPVRTQPCSWLLHHVYFIREIRGSWSCLRKLHCVISCWFVAQNAAAVSTSEWQRASCWALARSEPPLVRKLRRHKKLKIQAFYTCHQFLFLLLLFFDDQQRHWRRAVPSPLLLTQRSVENLKWMENDRFVILRVLCKKRFVRRMWLLCLKQYLLQESDFCYYSKNGLQSSAG